ncbi:unnamed protein product [Amoebophrya sp. A120]|nr:unnamed protein product [Amoebophrya sp. A120]|eukprot:GSA120T00011575001.1
MGFLDEDFSQEAVWHARHGTNAHCGPDIGEPVQGGVESFSYEGSEERGRLPPSSFQHHQGTIDCGPRYTRDGLLANLQSLRAKFPVDAEFHPLETQGKKHAPSSTSPSASSSSFFWDRSLSAKTEAQLEKIQLAFPPESAALKDPTMENVDLVLHQFLPDASKHLLQSKQQRLRSKPGFDRTGDQIPKILYQLARCCAKINTFFLRLQKKVVEVCTTRLEEEGASPVVTIDKLASRVLRDLEHELGRFRTTGNAGEDPNANASASVLSSESIGTADEPVKEKESNHVAAAQAKAAAHNWNYELAGTSFDSWSFLLTTMNPQSFPGGLQQIVRAMVIYVTGSASNFPTEEKRKVRSSPDEKVFSVRMGAMGSSELLMHWTRLIYVSAMEVMPELARVVAFSSVVEDDGTDASACAPDHIKKNPSQAKRRLSTVDLSIALAKKVSFSRPDGFPPSSDDEGNKPRTDFGNKAIPKTDSESTSARNVGAEGDSAAFSLLKRSAGAWKPSGKWRQKEKEGNSREDSQAAVRASDVRDETVKMRSCGTTSTSSPSAISASFDATASPVSTSETPASRRISEAATQLDENALSFFEQLHTDTTMKASFGPATDTVTPSTRTVAAPGSKQIRPPPGFEAAEGGLSSKEYVKRTSSSLCRSPISTTTTTAEPGGPREKFSLSSSPADRSTIAPSSPAPSSVLFSSPDSCNNTSCPSIISYTSSTSSTASRVLLGPVPVSSFLADEDDLPSEFELVPVLEKNCQAAGEGPDEAASKAVQHNSKNGACSKLSSDELSARTEDENNSGCFVQKVLQFLRATMTFDVERCGALWQELETLSANDWHIQNDWCISFQWTEKRKWQGGDLACFFVAVLAQVVSDTETFERHVDLAAQGRLMHKSNNTWCNEYTSVGAATTHSDMLTSTASTSSSRTGGFGGGRGSYNYTNLPPESAGVSGTKASKVVRFVKEVLTKCKKQHKKFLTHVNLEMLLSCDRDLSAYYGLGQKSPASTPSNKAERAKIDASVHDHDQTRHRRGGPSVLEIGSGNFSFADSFTQSAKFRGRYFASSKEDRETLLAKYGEQAIRAAENCSDRFSLLFNIDVSCPEATARTLLRTQPEGFQAVLFINPHAGDEREKNTRLLEQFFEVCSRVLDPRDERASAQITLAKPDVHYQQWNVSAVAARAGFKRVDSKPFFVSLFPAYQPVYGDKRDERNHQRRIQHGARIYFTCNPITYIFQRTLVTRSTAGVSASSANLATSCTRLDDAGDERTCSCAGDKHAGGRAAPATTTTGLPETMGGTIAGLSGKGTPARGEYEHHDLEYGDDEEAAPVWKRRTSNPRGANRSSRWTTGNPGQWSRGSTGSGGTGRNNFRSYQ